MIYLLNSLSLPGGTQRFLRDICRNWLGPDEKIEAMRQTCTLRLVTTKPKSEIMLREFNETLQQITTKTLPLNLVSSEPIDEALLEEVGRLTNTQVQISKTRKRVS